jgi:hypothetical protein
VQSKKLKWDKPKLVVLTKGKPQERVLAGCKIDGNRSGYNGSNSACEYTMGMTGCSLCSGMASS